MRIAVFVILLAGVARADAVLVGPAPVAGWEQWRVTEAGEQVTAYVQHDQRTLPLVVFAGGVRCALDTLPIDVTAARKRADFQLAAIDCTGNRNKDERARAVALAVRGLRTQPWVVRVLLAGHDEGADVAAAALRYLAPTDVAALGMFASGGISHLFGAVSEGRRANDAVRAQKGFDALLAMPDPSAVSTPLDDLVPSSVPVFVAHGTRDPSVDSADALVVELARRNAHRVLRYVILDGVDHDLRAADGTHGEELLAEFVKWSSTPAGRTVETRAFVPGASPQTHGSAPTSGMKMWLLVVLAAIAGAGAVLWRQRRRR